MQATIQLIEFMSNFYKVFPELQGMDTYLAGESYAGQFIPYFGMFVGKPIKCRG